MTIATNSEDLKPRLSRRTQLAEMLVLSGLFLLPAILGAFAPGRGELPLMFSLWNAAAHCLPLAALLLFILWRNGEPRFSIGLQFRFRDLALGLLLYVPFDAAILSLVRLFTVAGLRYHPVAAAGMSQPAGVPRTAACALVAAVVVFWEEPFFRGYLLLRLRGIGTGPVVAVIVSALVFGLEHLYQGMLGVAVTGVQGLLLGVLYLWRRNLTAPMVLHFLVFLAALGALPAVFRLPR